MYGPTQWKDHVEGVQEGTDLNAENLNNMEKGIMDAAALNAFKMSQEAQTGNLPYRASLEAGGGYCTDVPLSQNYFGMYTEKEWAVKPALDDKAERRTTDRFAGYPVYEIDIFIPDNIKENTYTLPINTIENTRKSSKSLILIECVGAYALNSDCWVPISEEKISVSVSGFDTGDGFGTRRYEVTVKTGSTFLSTYLPPHAIRLRYIYV